MFSEVVVLISLCRSKMIYFCIRCFILNDLKLKAKRFEFDGQIFYYDPFNVLLKVRKNS